LKNHVYYTKERKNWPPFYTTLFKKKKIIPPNLKKIVRISFFFLFPIYLQKIKKIWFQTKFFPSILKKNTAPKKEITVFATKKKIIISHFCFEIRLIIE